MAIHNMGRCLRLHSMRRCCYASLLFLAFFGIPGIYVAAKGPLYKERACTNRRGKIRAIVVGTGMLAVGGVLNAGLYFLGWLTGIFAFFWYGILAVGAVTFALGLASVISGRNLLAEMGEAESGQHNDT